MESSLVQKRVSQRSLDGYDHDAHDQDKAKLPAVVVAAAQTSSSQRRACQGREGLKREREIPPPHWVRSVAVERDVGKKSPAGEEKQHPD